MPESRPTVLSIAGYDPSSGAGVTADIKTIAAHGCYGVTCITALTVQSTAGVRRVQAVPGALVTETLEELTRDIGVSAVRIGMLGSGEVAEAVAGFLQGGWLRNVVLDPVLKSSSGAELLDEAGIELLRARLIGLADVLTPNVDEAAALTEMPVKDVASMKRAAAKLHEMGARAVVVTGGHLKKPVDVLSVRDAKGQLKQWECAGRRVESSSTHGTGCAFATALACNLARGFELKDSVKAAGHYVRNAIARAYPLGEGKGPVNHLYGMREA